MKNFRNATTEEKIDIVLARVLVYGIALCALAFTVVNLFRLNAVGIIAGGAMVYASLVIISENIKEEKNNGLGE